jgi:hypothetical protein
MFALETILCFSFSTTGKLWDGGWVPFFSPPATSLADLKDFEDY